MPAPLCVDPLLAKLGKVNGVGWEGERTEGWGRERAWGGMAGMCRARCVCSVVRRGWTRDGRKGEKTEGREHGGAGKGCASMAGVCSGCRVVRKMAGDRAVWVALSAPLEAVWAKPKTVWWWGVSLCVGRASVSHVSVC